MVGYPIRNWAGGCEVEDKVTAANRDPKAHRLCKQQWSKEWPREPSTVTDWHSSYGVTRGRSRCASGFHCRFRTVPHFPWNICGSMVVN